MKLYEIAQEYRRVGDLLDESGGELTPELEAAFDAVQGSLEDKTDAYAALVREAEAEAKSFGTELDRLKARKSVADNRAARLKARLLENLKAAGASKVRGPRFAVAVRVASTPTVRWEGPLDELPASFAVHKVELDGKAAIAACRAGTLPEGFRSFKSEYIEIR